MVESLSEAGLLEGRVRGQVFGHGWSAFMSSALAITVEGLSSLKTGFYLPLTASRGMKFKA